MDRTGSGTTGFLAPKSAGIVTRVQAGRACAADITVQDFKATRSADTKQCASVRMAFKDFHDDPGHLVLT